VHAFALSNFEKFSSTVKDFQVQYSSQHPREDQWKELGNFTARVKQGEQRFEMADGMKPIVRYLKFRFLSHYGNEFYCTLSQIK
jgi:hypothetical protein